MSSLKIAKTGYSRVFLIPGRARPDRAPSYQSCMKAGGLSQGFGDVEKIECPDPNNYGKFNEVGSIKGATERATTTLTGRYALNLASTMLEMARNGCPFDVQLHMGDCGNPSVFNDFKKAVVLEDVQITNYSTEDVGALSSDENAKVDESVDVSFKDLYEILPLSFASRAGSVVTNELIDVVVCDSISCGDCESYSTGCEKIFAISKAAGGSPSTPADLVYSLDGGANFYAHDVDTLDAAEEPTGIACLGEYVVVVASESNSLHYVDKSTITVTGDPSWTEVTTGFVATKTPLDIWSTGTRAFIVGTGGYIYMTEDPTSGVVVQDAGVATTDNLNAVHALNDNFAVAVGNNGAMVKTENGGETWTLVSPAPTGVGVHYNCVWVKSETEWIIGTADGTLYYTVDGGVNFATKSFSGSGSGVIYDVSFVNNTVGFMSHATSANRGRLFQTVDGGNSWFILPQNTGTFPLNDRLTAIATCTNDINFVVGVGLADDGADGFIVVGQD